MNKRRSASSTVLVGSVTGSALRRARLASGLRELAESLWGVAETVDLSPTDIARLILESLAVSAWKERNESAEARTLDLFDRSNDGRPYTFNVGQAETIVLTKDVVLVCPKCGELSPPQLRRMTDRPEIRNQPACSKCRSKH